MAALSGPSIFDMSADSALFTVIGGSLVNMAKVNYIQDSRTGQVLIFFENGTSVALDGTMATILMKIGGGKQDVP